MNSPSPTFLIFMAIILLVVGGILSECSACEDEDDLTDISWRDYKPCYGQNWCLRNHNESNQ